MLSSIGLLATRTPGKIVGPIAAVLGMFYNVIFNLIFSIIQSGSLGIAIILFTIIVKMILMPLTYKQQKSMYKMQKLQPQIKKIQDKYKDRQDRESQQRMAFEVQEFQKENGIGMLSGCLPMLIQLPILYGLFYLFQNAYLYVDVIGNNYNAIANVMLQAPVSLRLEALTSIVVAKNMTVDVAVAGDLVSLIHRLTNSDIQTILAGFGSYSDQLAPLLAQKTSIEYFLGMNMVANPGFSFPGIIVPILAGASTWISSKMMSQSTAAQAQGTGAEESTQGMMKTMNIIMPIMMGVMSFSLPAGMGIYWTVTNLVQLAQQRFLKKHFEKKDQEASKEAA